MISSNSPLVSKASNEELELDPTVADKPFTLKTDDVSLSSLREEPLASIDGSKLANLSKSILDNWPTIVPNYGQVLRRSLSDRDGYLSSSIYIGLFNALPIRHIDDQKLDARYTLQTFPLELAFLALNWPRSKIDKGKRSLLKQAWKLAFSDRDVVGNRSSDIDIIGLKEIVLQKEIEKIKEWEIWHSQNEQRQEVVGVGRVGDQQILQYEGYIRLLQNFYSSFTFRFLPFAKGVASFQEGISQLYWLYLHITMALVKLNQTGEQEFLKLLEHFDWYLLCGTCVQEYKEQAPTLINLLVKEKLLVNDAEKILINFHNSISLRTRHIGLNNDQVNEYVNAYRDIANTIIKK